MFCEVKARGSADHGDAAGAVDSRKQQRVRALAELWLIEHGVSLDDVSVRFDVVSVVGAQLTRLEAAF